MTKLVVLRIVNGDFNQGFQVTVQIGEEGKSTFVENYGSLPSAPRLPKLYNNWRSDYLNLEANYRIIEIGEPTSFSTVALSQQCARSAKDLKQYIRYWLNSERSNLQKIIKVLLKSIQDENEEIRIFLQTKNSLLKKIPWNEWDIFADICPNSEVALSPPEYSRVKVSMPTIAREQMRILAILGEHTDIDTQVDKEEIKGLPNAKPIFLEQPQAEQLSQLLRDEPGWDILFFAGHSSSSASGEIGQMNINADYALTIDQLRKALKKAIEQGLQLAIFNSCDGLGLAKQLADLNIPQVIVMREPVPDEVAQQFVKSFLKAFSSGQSLYKAVRVARESLISFEQDFPGVSWLPVICQNPAQGSTTWSRISIKKKVAVTHTAWSEEVQAKETWQCVHTLFGHSDVVRAVVIASDGQTIGSVSSDKTIKLWHLDTGKLLSTLTGHSKPIIAVAISPDQQTIASASVDKTIKLWHLTTGELLCTLRDDSYIVRYAWSVAFSPDGQTLASGHDVDGKIKLWHLPTRKLLRTIKRHSWGVSSVAFSPDSKILASGSPDSTIKLWNPSTGKFLGTLNGLSGWLSPVKSWLRAGEGVWCIAISPNSQLLASSGEEQLIKLWHLHTGELKSTLKSHSDMINSVAFSPDGQMLASGSADNTIKIWNLHTGELKYTLEHADQVYSLAFSPDGKRIISGSEDKTVKVWQMVQ